MLFYDFNYLRTFPTYTVVVYLFNELLSTQLSVLFFNCPFGCSYCGRYLLIT